MSDVFAEAPVTTTLKFGAGYDAAWLVLRHGSADSVLADLRALSPAVAAAGDVTPFQAVAIAAREAQAAWSNPTPAKPVTVKVKTDPKAFAQAFVGDDPPPPPPSPPDDPDPFVKGLDVVAPGAPVAVSGTNPDDPFGAAVDLVKDKLGGVPAEPLSRDLTDWPDGPPFEDDDDGWGTPAAKAAPQPAAPSWGGSAAPADAPPSCKHGPRQRRSGKRKDGSEWVGYFCRLQREDPDNCGTQWVN